MDEILQLKNFVHYIAEGVENYKIKIKVLNLWRSGFRLKLKVERSDHKLTQFLWKNLKIILNEVQ